MNTALRAANRDRVKIFHSTVQGFTPGPPALMHIAILKADRKAATLTVSRGQWTVEEIHAVALGFSRLTNRLRTITDETMSEEFRRSLRME